MSTNLIRKGPLTSPLNIFNRTLTKTQEFASKFKDTECAVHSTLSAFAASSTIIFICLSDDAAVRATIKELCATSITGKLIIDCSTIHPTTTTEIAEQITSHGAEFVAMPVFGAPAVADAGLLVCVPAGPSKSVDKVLPYCNGVLGRHVISFAGEDYTKAATLKLLGNTLVFQMVEALSAAHVVAEKCGIGSSKMHEVIDSLFGGVYTNYSRRMISGDYSRDDPLFAVDLARKDIRHARDIAGACGAEFKALEVADCHLRVVRDVKGMGGDMAGIYGAVRIENGMEY